MSQEPMNAARFRILQREIIEKATTFRRCWLIDASIRNASSGRLRSSATNSVFGTRITALDASARALAG